MANHAIILAAGLGLRMRPLTEQLPKPLVEVAGRTLIDRALDYVQEGGVETAIVNISYLADLMRNHLEKRHKPYIIVSHEPEPLETGGGIAKVLAHFNGKPFYSLNSDAITLSGTVHPFQRLMQAWDDTRMDALLLLHPCEEAVGYAGKGDFFISRQQPEQSPPSSGREKFAATGGVIRRKEHEIAPYVFTGMQLIHPRLFADAPQGAYSLNVLYNRNLSRIHALVHDGKWLHVGSPQELVVAEKALLARYSA